jgi:hypothetical protein
LSAVGISDALVAQADAEHGDPWPEKADDLVRYTCVLGAGRAARNDDARRMHFFDFIGCSRIVAHNLYFLPEFRETLRKVVGEAVVIVYQK